MKPPDTKLLTSIQALTRQRMFRLMKMAEEATAPSFFNLIPLTNIIDVPILIPCFLNNIVIQFGFLWLSEEQLLDLVLTVAESNCNHTFSYFFTDTSLTDYSSLETKRLRNTSSIMVRIIFQIDFSGCSVKTRFKNYQTGIRLTSQKGVFEIGQVGDNEDLNMEPIQETVLCTLSGVGYYLLNLLILQVSNVTSLMFAFQCLLLIMKTNIYHLINSFV